MPDRPGPTCLNSGLHPEENRYVEFGPNGTKVILRKTTKGIWKIALVRNFDRPEGQVTCDGFIRESWDADSALLSDFKRLVGDFDRESYQYETTRNEYGEGEEYCVIDGAYCPGMVYAEFTYTYRHEVPLRTVPGNGDSPYDCSSHWGCGEPVEVEGVQNLVTLEATIVVEDVGEFEFTLDHATEFSSWELLDWDDIDPDASDYADKTIRAIDAETG